ncbi:hypothetical protein [Nostoc sp. TCL26-01]|uniref:hypothetical protein n=1 Tax=Nostoc sp. TCL26-01 TaxID=2576904 RepID=UPI0015BF7F5F|nr:hypothetical protein [Nostoc sp. TCL26-01]QLE54777.1 hypothetical protein FD725_04180 [Nostoc sp. TCL26-01]
MNPFVGMSPKDLCIDELLYLIKQLTSKNSYYFWRCTHQVSGIVEEPPTKDDFPSMLEGQMFNYECELRWKKKSKDTYAALLLTIADNHHHFKAISEDNKVSWRIEPSNNTKFPSYAYPAYGYRADETRFPKKLIYPPNLNIRLKDENKKNPKLAQRYFIDNATSTVQFVALTVEIDQDDKNPSPTTEKTNS